MRRVASSDGCDVVDEFARRRAQARAWTACFEAVDVRDEARLGVLRVRWPVGPIWVGRDQVSDVAKNLDVALDAAGSTRAVPVWRQGVREFVEKRRGGSSDVLCALFFVRSCAPSPQPAERPPAGCDERVQAAREEPFRSRGSSHA